MTDPNATMNDDILFMHDEVPAEVTCPLPPYQPLG